MRETRQSGVVEKKPLCRRHGCGRSISSHDTSQRRPLRGAQADEDWWDIALTGHYSGLHRRVEIGGIALPVPSQSPPVVKALGVPTDRAGRRPVDSFFMLPGVDGVFAVGDGAALTQGKRPLPGVAQVAIQQGRYVGQVIHDSSKADRRGILSDDKGSMAVVGEDFAVLARGFE
jgi:hypothetical protein